MSGNSSCCRRRFSFLTTSYVVHFHYNLNLSHCSFQDRKRCLYSSSTLTIIITHISPLLPLKGHFVLALIVILMQEQVDASLELLLPLLRPDQERVHTLTACGLSPRIDLKLMRTSLRSSYHDVKRSHAHPLLQMQAQGHHVYFR